MQFQTLEVTCTPDGVAQVTMARPNVFNAFDELMIAELDAAFAKLGTDPAIRVVVLAGKGKSFSAGADLQWMQRASTASRAENLEDARRFASMLSRVALCAKPTIAVVQGIALGGGVGLVCACDFAIAARDAKFAVTEVKFGILPSVIGPYLIQALGKRQALRLALSAARIDAEEALSIGLVQQVVEGSDLASVSAGLVRELTRNGPAALSEVKSLFSSLGAGAIDEATRELTAQTIARVRTTDEAREGFAAFLAKRPPAWAPVR